MLPLRTELAVKRHLALSLREGLWDQMIDLEGTAKSKKAFKAAVQGKWEVIMEGLAPSSSRLSIRNIGVRTSDF